MEEGQTYIRSSNNRLVISFENLNKIEWLFIFVYKYLLELLFIPTYLEIWGYLNNNRIIHFEISKSIISCVLLFSICIIYCISNHINCIYDFAFKLFLYLAIIPCFSMYSVVEDFSITFVLCPFTYFLLFSIFIKKIPNKQNKYGVGFIKLRNVDVIVSIVSFVFVLAFWTYLGFPVGFGLQDTYDQRMNMRVTVLPSVINYLYLMLGNTIIPFLFAKFLMNKRIKLALLSLVSGILLFFSNGMKTWLLLYVIGIGIFLCARLLKNNYKSIVLIVEFFFCAVIVLAIIILYVLNNNFLVGQLGRILVMPPNIGFKSISFFTDPEHELLFLRESILKFFFEAPYPGGSDFYINYGTNITVNSARANNGLWGDAFRNFGFWGMTFYPIMLLLVFKIVVNSMKNQNLNVQLFIVLLLVWSSINSSFFTWLLTGGIILLVLLLKTEKTKTNMVNTNLIDSEK